jgi:hypothetical protein
VAVRLIYLYSCGGIVHPTDDQCGTLQRYTDALPQELIPVSLFTTYDVDSPGIEPGRLWLEAAAG